MVTLSTASTSLVVNYRMFDRIYKADENYGYDVPSLPSFDLPNNRIYAMDPGPGKVAAINLNQETGNMTLAWSVDEKTPEWTVLIGPASQRVLVGTNLQTNVTNPLEYDAGPIGPNYKERIRWREAASKCGQATVDSYTKD